MGIQNVEARASWLGKSSDGAQRDLGMHGPVIAVPGAHGAVARAMAQVSINNKVKGIPLIGTDPRTKRALENTQSTIIRDQYWAGKDLRPGRSMGTSWSDPKKTGKVDNMAPNLTSSSAWQPPIYKLTKQGEGYRSEKEGFGDGKRRFIQRKDIPNPFTQAQNPWDASDVQINDRYGTSWNGMGPGMIRDHYKIQGEVWDIMNERADKQFNINESNTKIKHQQLDAPYGIIGANMFGDGDSSPLGRWKQAAINYGEGALLSGRKSPVIMPGGNYPNVPGSNERRYEMGTGVGYQENIHVLGKGVVKNKAKPKKYYKSRTDILSILFGL